MLAIACDHAAVEFKQEIIAHLKKRGIPCKDFGAFDADSVDYPDYARPVAEGVASGAFEYAAPVSA